MIRLATFDCNGTLLADTQAVVDAANHVIRTYGGNPVSRDEYAATFDFPVTDFYRRQGCDAEALLGPEPAEMFHEFYEARASQCRTRQGTREVLSWLKERSVPSVVLSTHMKEAIATQLERLRLTGYFDQILANTELGSTQTGNNKIQRMTDYLTGANCNPSDAIIVGDSPEDIEIGKTLGMRTVAITGGCFSTPRLRASKPDYLIGNLKELIKIFES